MPSCCCGSGNDVDVDGGIAHAIAVIVSPQQRVYCRGTHQSGGDGPERRLPAAAADSGGDGSQKRERRPPDPVVVVRTYGNDCVQRLHDGAIEAARRARARARASPAL